MNINPYPPTVPLLEGQSRFLVQNLPLSCFFITLPHVFLGTNLSLDLIYVTVYEKTRHICKFTKF